MQKSSLTETKLYDKLLNYSRKFMILKWKENFVLGIFSIVLSATVIGILFVFESIYNMFPADFKLLTKLFIFIISTIIIRILIDIVRRTNEIKELKKREKIYIQTFIKLNGEYVRAREEIKARDEFLTITSHELKTPLTSMLLKLHNMINNVRNVSLANFSVPELMKVLENAEHQVKLLTTMINDLLNISLITTGRMNLHLETVNLVEVVRKVKENFSEILNNGHCKVKIEARSPVIGLWDKTRIEQVITNLLSNAIKYGENKPIEIKVTSNNGIAKFVIKDLGIGIAPEKQKILFNRFTRVASADIEKKGLGVGLYIANQIVNIHNGKIKIFSIPNKGSTFTVELPMKAVEKT